MNNPQSRDSKFDNLKGIMIFLVVCCHFTDKMYAAWPDDSLVRFIYYTIYFFHMPVFIFISGFFSQKRRSDEYFRKTVSGSLIPYIVVDFLHGMFGTRGDIKKSILQLTRPHWTLWYLLSLFYWKLLALPISMFRWPILISVLAALFVGLTNLSFDLSLARTFCFLPYFMLGYTLSNDSIQSIRKKSKIYPILGFAFVLAISVIMQWKKIDIYVLYMSIPYRNMPALTAMLYRLIVLMAGFVSILGFVAIVPDKHCILSVIGKNSVLIYLVHAMIIRIIMRYTSFRIENGRSCILIATAFSAIVCLVFGSEPLARVYSSAINLISNAVLKKSNA